MLSKKTSGNKSSSLLCGLSHLLISSIFTLRLIYFGVLVFECRYHYVACVHLLKPLKNFGTFVLEIKRSLSCVLWVHCVEAVKLPPRRGLTAPSGLRARSVGVLDLQPTTGVPEVDECDSPRSVTRRKRHVAHNLDRFGPRGA
jgi:hypothetical protein